MDSNQLYQFRIIAELKSLTKASEKLFITQPALSISINKLQKELGCDLFIRNKKEMQLTPEGERLLVYAIKVTDTIQEAKEFFLTSDKRKNVKLCRVGGTNFPLISKGCASLEDVHFSGRLIKGEDVKKLIDRDEADIIICDDYNLPYRFDNYAKVFLYTQFMIYCTPRNYISNESNIVSISELHNQSITGHENPSGFSSWFKEVIKLNGCYINIARNLNYSTWQKEAKELPLPYVINSFGLSTDWELIKDRSLYKVKGKYTERNIYILYKTKKEADLMPVLDLICNNVKTIQESDDKIDVLLKLKNNR